MGGRARTHLEPDEDAITAAVIEHRRATLQLDLALHERGARPAQRDARDRNAEARVQAAVVEWLRWVAPSVIVYAIPNGGYRTKAEAARLKWVGVLAGIPDLGLVLPDGRAGFFEIKPPKRSRLSDEQEAMLPRLEMMGARCAVIRSIEDARAAFKAWGIETREVASA